MASGFFVLSQFFLRVDGVLVRLNESRFYHQVSCVYRCAADSGICTFPFVLRCDHVTSVGTCMLFYSDLVRQKFNDRLAGSVSHGD